MGVGSPGNRLPWELCCLHGAARGGGLMVGPSVGLRCVFLLCMEPGAQHTARCSLVQAMGWRGQGSAGGSTSASVSSARVKAWQGGWGPAALISIVAFPGLGGRCLLLLSSGGKATGSLA